MNSAPTLWRPFAFEVLKFGVEGFLTPLGVAIPFPHGLSLHLFKFLVVGDVYANHAQVLRGKDVRNLLWTSLDISLHT